MKITVFIGAGNMLLVGLPLAHNLTNSGVVPLFAVRREGRYAEFFDTNTPFTVNFMDRTAPENLIQSYQFIPVKSVSEISFPISQGRFFIIPLDVLKNIHAIPNVEIVASFISVGAGNIRSSIEEILSILTPGSKCPVFLLENMSYEKEQILRDYYDDNNIKIVNCVIRRTSSDWRILGNSVYINTRNDGLIKYSEDIKDIELKSNIDGVDFIKLLKEEILREEAIKFYGTNFVDYLIARYLTKNVFVDFNSDFLFENHRPLADCIIKNLLYDTDMSALEAMINVINHCLVEDFSETTSSAYRIDIMREEKLGRILKKDKSAHLQKLNFCRQKAVDFLHLNNPDFEKLNSVKYAEGISKIKSTLDL